MTAKQLQNVKSMVEKRMELKKKSADSKVAKKAPII